MEDGTKLTLKEALIALLVDNKKVRQPAWEPEDFIQWDNEKGFVDEDGDCYTFIGLGAYDWELHIEIYIKAEALRMMIESGLCFQHDDYGSNVYFYSQGVQRFRVKNTMGVSDIDTNRLHRKGWKVV